MKVAALFALLLLSKFVGLANAEVSGRLEAGPLVLLNEPFHVGDNVMKTFRNPDPQGIEIYREFDLDQSPLSDVFVIIWISELVPKQHPNFIKGYYRTQLVINGEGILTLNNRIRGKADSPNIEKLVIQLDRKKLRKGQNSLEIKGGAHGGNYDDFEVHRIILSKDRNQE